MSAINVNAMMNFIFKVEMTRGLPQSGENRVALSGVRRVFENEAARCVSVSVPCSKHTSLNWTPPWDSRLFLPGMDSDYGFFLMGVFSKTAVGLKVISCWPSFKNPESSWQGQGSFG